MSACPECGSAWSGTLSCPECARRERDRNNPPKFPIDPVSPSAAPTTMEEMSVEETSASPSNVGDRFVAAIFGPPDARKPGICAQCLAAFDADAKYCPSCAAPVSADATCPKCDKPLIPGAKFCKYCATPLITRTEERSFITRSDTLYDDSVQRERSKAEKLAIAGGVTAGISALLFFWGYSYTSSFANAGRAALMNLSGQTDSTYQLAQWCVTLGVIGFIVGLVLFIVGMAQR